MLVHCNQGDCNGHAAASSKVCKELLLSCRQCLCMLHGGQRSIVIKIAGIIYSLDHRPEKVTICNSLTVCLPPIKLIMPLHNAMLELPTTIHSAWVAARGACRKGCEGPTVDTYLMGADMRFVKHASQSRVLNQACDLMSVTPPLRLPNLLLRSACMPTHGHNKLHQRMV